MCFAEILRLVIYDLGHIFTSMKNPFCFWPLLPEKKQVKKAVAAPGKRRINRVDKKAEKGDFSSKQYK
ncbi:hypothetical protein CYR55_17295 [Chimaeribacter californicus]|uniref:Uncharacterized protein n=1 Tax=Chimaeribacter californicus TaxID=2060067 RepID=A0A2N5DZR8_9GAMM|nr:hypothetical protein CYR55_17295 [Chimaeribacter californicus]